MAGQQKVQEYLTKHRISNLFEDLMARLVQNLPSDPIPYLIRILQKFDDKANKQPHEGGASKTKASVGAPPKKISRTSSRELHRSSSTGLPSEWTAAGMPGMGEDRGYDRPWIQNMKKIQRSPDSSVEDSPRVRKPKIKPVTSPAADVEKVFKKPIAKKPTSKKLTKTSELWAADGEEPASRMPAPSDQPRPTNQQQEEMLRSEELSTTSLAFGRKSREVEKEKEDMMMDAAAVEQKRQKRGKDTKIKQHKQELAQLAASQREVEDIGVLDTGEEDTEPDQAGFQEATDILEDADELMDEGVSNAKPGGQRVKKSSKSAEAQVKISMCSQCARLIKGDSASTVGPRRGFEAYTSLESSSSSDFPSSEVGGGGKPCPQHATAMSDDDFESASQVTGPRQPVWVESETEDVGSRGDAKSIGKESEVFGGAQQQEATMMQVRQSGWDSDGGDERFTGRVETLGERGRSWQQPGSDDDSSV